MEMRFLKANHYRMPFKAFVYHMQKKGIRNIIGKCQECGTTENLTVHHEGDIITKVLCRRCHDRVHNIGVKR